MTSYHDQDGNEITQARWIELLSDDNRVAFGQVTFQGKQLDVSTVWLGIGERRNNFETMVFGDCNFDQDCARYATKAQAIEGHRRAMENLAEGRAPWWLHESSV